MTARQAAIRPAGCPPWCEIGDHDDADGNQGAHSAYRTVCLSAYPFTAHGREYHETMIVALDLDLDDAVVGDGEPHVTIVPRDEDIASVMRLTLAEAVVAEGRHAGARRAGSGHSQTPGRHARPGWRQLVSRWFRQWHRAGAHAARSRPLSAAA